MAGRCAGETKTHDCCQPWVFVKLLRSTNANGIAGYDDYQNDSLQDVFQHYGDNVAEFGARSSLNLFVLFVDISRQPPYALSRISSAKPFADMSANNSDPYNATVIGREEINPQLLILRVRPDGELFDFRPGQFGVLGLLGSAPRVEESTPEDVPSAPDKIIRRAYSIASASIERRYLEFYLTLITSGQLTPRLFALQHGSRVFLGPKASGIFTLDRVAPEKAVVLIATGTGLAPYVSMLRTMLVNDSQRRL